MNESGLSTKEFSDELHRRLNRLPDGKRKRTIIFMRHMYFEGNRDIERSGSGKNRFCPECGSTLTSLKKIVKNGEGGYYCKSCFMKDVHVETGNGAEW